MPCYHPIPAWRDRAGSVVFSRVAGIDGEAPFELPCGQCLGCRLQRSADNALRCRHEAQLHDQNSFLTLTFEDESLPSSGYFATHAEWHGYHQRFMKRLRKKYGASRFYMCGEYGETNPITGEVDGGLYRPHFHTCLFGLDFPDKQQFKRNHQDDWLYTSKALESVWPHGHATVGALTYQSAAYVTRYCLKKVNGDLAEAHYGGRPPEYTRCSLRPGIGAAWLQRFRSDVFPCDYVVSDGHKHHVPKFYDKLNKRHDERELGHVKSDRIDQALTHSADNTPSRLAVKEEVKRAQVRTLTRHL